jgi:hypothetical protein
MNSPQTLGALDEWVARRVEVTRKTKPKARREKI